MAVLGVTPALSAQNYRSAYSMNGSSVYYDGIPIQEANAKSFQILGYGYAKDANFVYLDGRVLEFVDPYGFRVIDNSHQREPQPGDFDHGHGSPHDPSLEHSPNHGHNHKNHREKSGYFKSNWDVFYDGGQIEGAHAQSFVELEYGYAKDSFNVYYKGRKVDGAMPSKFVIDRDGYAHDTFGTYYRGEKISR